MRTDFIGKIPLCLHLNLCCYRMASSWAPREYWQRFTRYVTCGTCTCWTVLDPPPLKNWEWCVLGPSMLKLFRKWCCDVVMCFFRKLWYTVITPADGQCCFRFLGSAPYPVITTRLLTFLRGNPNGIPQPSFATAILGGEYGWIWIQPTHLGFHLGAPSQWIAALQLGHPVTSAQELCKQATQGDVVNPR